ncbi:DUF2501 domain-containing protein [Sphingomonas sp. Leaf343]|uniref:DUF2501 domain-containing protein n=1 Tax=Sphingomonas sp. Leaf343 TaxID=1736345 RepID=UPI0006F802F6|nr:DUF2501 domain-containing protein [Sphingomonas sp. Leaf343]KQR84228.1 hypothetical protein ASG07_06480 [Sphingomonas sp. Leaf343]
MKTLLATALLVSPAIAVAQTNSAPQTAAPRAGGLLEQAGGLLGGGLPQLGAIGAGNAAGLLGYCVKNNVLGGANASGILGKLAGQQGVANSPGFLAGQRGTVQTGGDEGLSLASLKGRVKTQVCNQVLKRAQSFL